MNKIIAKRMIIAIVLTMIFGATLACLVVNGVTSNAYSEEGKTFTQGFGDGLKNIYPNLK